jgi:hypothetical protein
MYTRLSLILRMILSEKSATFRDHALTARFLACSIFAGGVVLTTAAAAQHDESVPDFSSNLAGWVATTPEFLPVTGATGPVTGDPAHPYINNATARRNGTQPTYRVADLTNPNLKPWAKEVMKRENDKVLAGGIGFTARSSCMPAGVPAFMMFAGVEPMYFLQTPKEVTMIFTGDAQVRHVYLNVPHSANPKLSWYGESVGHYEGNTLMIDTIGMNDKTYVDNFRTPHTQKLHVVERWKLVDADTIDVNFTVDDPDTFDKPWTAQYDFRRVTRPMNYEEVCAENNLQFAYHVPVAVKPDF